MSTGLLSKYATGRKTRRYKNPKLSINAQRYGVEEHFPTLLAACAVQEFFVMRYAATTAAAALGASRERT